MIKIILTANTDWYLYNFRISLAEFLREKEYEVIFVSPKGKFVEKIIQRGFKWIEWKLNRKSTNPFSELIALRKLAKVFKDEKPNLIHNHTIKSCLYGTLAARIVGVHSVVNSITGRGYVFSGQDKQANFLRSIVKVLYKIALNHKNCNLIFENANDQNYFIEEKLVSSPLKTKLIKGVGVDEKLFFPVEEPKGKTVVLLASRMLWEKGVGVLVDATKILKEKYDFTTVLAGEPDPSNPGSISEEILKKWEKEGLVEWWGFQAEINKVYQKSHIVTLPTMYNEGVPTNLLEASSSSRPIVASDMPGCTDFVIEGKNGFLVPKNDSKSLANALEKLLNNADLRKKMGVTGRKMILENYTKGIVNTKTLEVYKKLLS